MLVCLFIFLCGIPYYECSAFFFFICNWDIWAVPSLEMLGAYLTSLLVVHFDTLLLGLTRRWLPGSLTMFMACLVGWHCQSVLQDGRAKFCWQSTRFLVVSEHRQFSQVGQWGILFHKILTEVFSLCPCVVNLGYAPRSSHLPIIVHSWSYFFSLMYNLKKVTLKLWGIKTRSWQEERKSRRMYPNCLDTKEGLGTLTDEIHHIGGNTQEVKMNSSLYV